MVDIDPGEPPIVIDTPLGFGSLTVPLRIEGGMEYYVELAAQADSVPTAGAVPYLLSTLKSDVKQYCRAGWCAGVIAKSDALPKVEKLGLETPSGP